MKIIKWGQLSLLILFAAIAAKSNATNVISIDHFASTDTTQNVGMVFDKTVFQKDYKSVFRLFLSDTDNPVRSVQTVIDIFHDCSKHDVSGSINSVDMGTTYKILGSRLVSNGSVAFVGTHIEFTHTCRLYSIVPEVAAAYGSMGDYYFKIYQRHKNYPGTSWVPRMIREMLAAIYKGYADTYYSHQLHHLGQ